jgi:hypothetical protein
MSRRAWPAALLVSFLLWGGGHGVSAPAADPAAPAVRLTAPAMNAEVAPGAALTLAAVVTDPRGPVTKVDFFDDDALVGTAAQAPYTVSYRPPAGKRNFTLTARIGDAVSPPVTCVAAHDLPRRYRSYDYAETAEGMDKRVRRLSIPEGLAVVRGLLVVTNPNGGDTRDWHLRPWYGEWLHSHDFAFLGARGFTSHEESLQVMQHALAHIAQDAHHPELVNVPYATTGFSAGGGFASRVLVDVPERVIASVIVCARINLTGLTPNTALLRTPACVITGELEKTAPFVAPVLAAWRPQGAQWGWMTVQKAGHAMVGQDVLALPFLDAAVRLRYPAGADVRRGPVELNALDANNGWLADNASWHGGLVSIAPAAAFKGDVAQSSWLPSEDVAFIYRAYATYDPPLAITSPQPSWPRAGWDRQRVWDPGANVTFVVDDAAFPAWRKLAFYDGARLLGEITHGPAQFTALNLAPGDHAMSVLGTDAQGAVRPSNPVLVVVRQP